MPSPTRLLLLLALAPACQSPAPAAQDRPASAVQDGPAPSAPRATATDDAPFVLDDAFLREHVARARPAIEAALGRTLPEAPRVRVGTVDEVRAILAAEQTRMGLAQGFDEETAKTIGEAAADALAPALLGKYSLADGEVLIVPDSFETLARLVGVPELTSEGVARAVVTHELVHAADAALHGFPAVLEGLDELDAILAYQAVIEGHAQLVAREACAALGLSEDFETFTRSITALPEDRDLDAALELMLRVLTANFTTPYVDGERFVAAIRAGGGEAAVARVFTEPPRRIDVVFHPEWFLDPSLERPSMLSLDDGLAAMEAGFSSDDWIASKVTVTPVQLDAILALLPEESVARLKQVMGRNRVLVLNSKSSPGNALVSFAVYDFPTPADGEYYREALRELLHVKDEAMAEGAIRIVRASYEDVDDRGLQGVISAKEVRAMGQSVEVTTLIANLDTVGFEISFTNVPVEPEDLVELAHELHAAARGAAGAPAGD